jgi:hypothetical protein
VPLVDRLRLSQWSLHRHRLRRRPLWVALSSRRRSQKVLRLRLRRHELGTERLRGMWPHLSRQRILRRFYLPLRRRRRDRPLPWGRRPLPERHGLQLRLLRGDELLWVGRHVRVRAGGCGLRRMLQPGLRRSSNRPTELRPVRRLVRLQELSIRDLSVVAVRAQPLVQDHAVRELPAHAHRIDEGLPERARFVEARIPPLARSRTVVTKLLDPSFPQPRLPAFGVRPSV